MPNKRPSILRKSLGRFLFVLSFTALFHARAYSLEDLDNFFIKADSEIRLSLRPDSQNWFSAPTIGLLNVNSALEPTDNLLFSLTAMARIPIKAESPHIDAFADLGESYLKYSHPKFVLSLGQLRLPWRTLKGAAINDRVNPVDYRRGYQFSTQLNSFVAQWGASVTADVLGLTTQGAYFFWHRPNPSSMVSVEQDGVQIGHYQGSLARTHAELADLFSNPLVRKNVAWFSDPAVSLRASKLLGDINLALNAIWGFDEVPVLLPGNELGVGRALSFGVESSISLGVAILKAEAVITPRINDEVGKVTLLKSVDLFSKSLTNAQIGVGIDAQYGDAISGSFEIIDTLWFDVPSDCHLYALEAPDSRSNESRVAHRLALGFVFGGRLAEEAVSWNLKGEMGLNRWDLLSTLDAQYNFGETGFAVGAFSNLFFGVAQSPGWFRSPATEIGLKAVYNLQ